MKTLHMHIGSNKTGTTSIQNTFHMNRKMLNKLGFHYPGEKSNHHLSYFATKAPSKEWPRSFKVLDKDKLSRAVNQYFSKLEKGFNTDFKQQIMSNEYLFTDKEQQIKNYLDYLSKFFPEIKIYVFVRDPVDYYNSAQQQMLKGRSYVRAPQAFYYKFKNVIEAWQKYCPIEVIEYIPGVDSCESLCDKIGVDFKKLSKPQNFSNTTLSIHQIVLLEKLQRYLYSDKENQMKHHLKKVIGQISGPASPPRLKPEVQRSIQNKHHGDLEWLKNNFGVDLLKEFSNEISSPMIPNFENNRATVRDVYQIDDEQTIEQYEAVVIDTLVKKSVQESSKSSILKRTLNFLKSLNPRI